MCYVCARVEQRAKRSAYISQLWQLPAAEKVAATGEVKGGGAEAELRADSGAVA